MRMRTSSATCANLARHPLPVQPPPYIAHPALKGKCAPAGGRSYKGGPAQCLAVYGFQVGMGIDDQHVDRLFTKPELQSSNEAQGFLLRLGDGGVRGDQQVDIAAPRLIIDPRPEKLHLHIRPEDFPDRLADHFPGGFREPLSESPDARLSP